MPQTTRGTFLLREPPRPPAVAVGAALAGRTFTLRDPREERVVVVGGKQFDRQTSSKGAGRVIPASRGFSSPPLTKGSLTNLRTRDRVVFMFNPAEVGRADGWSWGTHQIPGASHPVLNGGSGSGRSIAFSVFLDADRGRSQLRRAALADTNFDGDRSLDLTSELNLYLRFTYPQGPSQTGIAQRGGPLVIFRFGPFYPGVRCVVERVNINVTSWTPKLEPVKAVVEVSLLEQVPQSLNESNFSVGLPDDDNQFFDQISGSEV